MKVGYIINGTHPLLETIEFKDIKPLSNRKILIVGMAEAISYDPTIPLYDSNFKEDIGYCFSHLEGKENYDITLNGFVTYCVEQYIKDYKFHFISELSSIKWTKEVFKYETPIGLYIVNSNKEIYYYNKSFMAYFDKSIKLEMPIDTIVWQWEDTFSALLKSNNCYVEQTQFKNTLTSYCDISKFFAAACIEWKKELPICKTSYDTWVRAYKIENYLSTLKVRMNVPLLEELSETNSICKAVLDHVENSCVTQHYKGTDKTTGRIFPSGDGYSLQTFPHEMRTLVVADEGCYLVEFDYQHFEYSLLGQIIGFNLPGDPHLELAKLLFKDESKRPIAKTINYGLLYGKSLNTMITELINEHKVPYTREELIKLLEPITKPIEELNQKLQKELEERGFITNRFGREVFPSKKFACVNNYIQATAADYIIIKIEKIKNYLEGKYPNKIVLQNHDSILINLSIKDIEKTDIALDILTILESEENSLVTKVDLKYGTSWAFTN